VGNPDAEAVQREQALIIHSTAEQAAKGMTPQPQRIRELEEQLYGALQAFMAYAPLTADEFHASAIEAKFRIEAWPTHPLGSVPDVHLLSLSAYGRGVLGESLS